MFKFDPKPHKVRNARILLGVVLGLVAGIVARQAVYHRFGFDPGDSQLESFLSGANAIKILAGAIAFGLIGGLCGAVLGFFMGRANPIPPPVSLLAIAVAAILTLDFEWVLSANLLFLVGYLLFTVEGAILYDLGRRKAVERAGPIEPETEADDA